MTTNITTITTGIQSLTTSAGTINATILSGVSLSGVGIALHQSGTNVPTLTNAGTMIQTGYVQTHPGGVSILG